MQVVERCTLNYLYEQRAQYRVFPGRLMARAVQRGVAAVDRVRLAGAGRRRARRADQHHSLEYAARQRALRQTIRARAAQNIYRA